MQFWLIATACGAFQAFQAMTNVAAIRSGIGPIWVGAMSATVSAISLIILAGVVYRLPLPSSDLLATDGWKTLLGGLMGAFIVTGVAYVAPKLGPTQTFVLYFAAIAIVSALIDNFGLLGTPAKALGVKQLLGVLLAGLGLVLARS
jgi:bacterial/archaeal transporter family-2 protein